MRPWVAVLLLLVAAASASAQTIEITPVAGYRFGGSFKIADTSSALEVRDSGAFGAHLGVRVAPDGEIEFLFSRQGTRLRSGGFFTSEALFDLRLETYELGGSYLFRDEDAKVRPYIGLGMGLTRLVPEPRNLETETRFSASIAGGVKAYVGPHLAFRFEIRGFFTVFDSDSRIFCSPGLPCVVSTKGSDLSQAEIRGGLIFRF